jgi:hypothetical protein
MTSPSRPGAAQTAAQTKLQTLPTQTPRKSGGRERPCRKRRSRRAADRTCKLTFRRPLPAHFHDIARAKGFNLEGRGCRSSDLKLKCLNCDQSLQVRRSVVINNKVECNHCLWRRRFDSAMAVGATILSAVPRQHKLAHLVLKCGHVATRQYGRIERAARGGHDLGCEDCREARYAEEADGSGWTLVGKAQNDKQGYRAYRHRCGHTQDHMTGNMLTQQIDCAGCGETWASKPSKIYLFRITLRRMTVLKFGFSSNPPRRLYQQLGDAARDTGQILRVIDLRTGHAALNHENWAHNVLRRNHPEIVVPRSAFEGQITTKSEIYTCAAEPHIRRLMDVIESKHAIEQEDAA